jgi:hypothetical protein
MIEFRAYASNFELFPKEGEAFRQLLPLLGRLKKVDFILRVNNPSANQGQMVSDFDDELEKILLARGATHFDLHLPPEIPQKFDFAFEYSGRTVAVEIEKTNLEKILRDILKCHMYLHAGADFAMVVLPKNYPHKHSVWNLFDFGVQRFSECKAFGFGTPYKLGRILLLGFEQFDSSTNESLTTKTRQQMREEAAAQN